MLLVSVASGLKQIENFVNLQHLNDTGREFVTPFCSLLRLELENERINSYIVSMKRHWGSIFEG